MRERCFSVSSTVFAFLHGGRNRGRCSMEKVTCQVPERANELCRGVDDGSMRHFVEKIPRIVVEEFEGGRLE